MKKLLRLSTLFFGILLLQAKVQAQTNANKKNYPVRQSVNLHRAIYTYVGDIVKLKEMDQPVLGIGYKRINRKNWYVGFDLQFVRNKNTYVEYEESWNAIKDRFYIFKTNRFTAGYGYIVLTNASFANQNYPESDVFYRAKYSDIAPTTLYAKRLNLLFNVGKHWDYKRGSLDFGVTLAGTYYEKSFEQSEFLNVGLFCTSKATGEPLIDFVTAVGWTKRVEKIFFPSAGFNLLYDYRLTPKFNLGMQMNMIASAEGTYLQLAPKISYRFGRLNGQ